MLAVGVAPRASALDEIGEPAGDLPENDNLPDVAPTEADLDAEANGPTPKAALKDNAADEEKAAETWDSYSEAGTGGVAQDITKGVRVEDIVEPPSDYRYAAFGKADPFVPPMVTSDKPAGPGNLEIPIVSPLQRFEVGTLQLVGVWQLASGERKAMVLTPGTSDGSSAAGQGIIVKNGDPIGTRGGKILGIGDDFLTVREFTLAVDGTRQYEDQQMYMGTRSPDEKPGKIIFKPGVAETEVRIEGGTPAAPVSAEPGALTGDMTKGVAQPPNGPAPVDKPGVGNGDMGGASPGKPATPATPAMGGPLPQAGQPAASSKASAYTSLQAPSPPPSVSAPEAPASPAALPVIDNTFPPAKTF
jgi:Tfp pilus assembly protein PilP